MSYDISLTIFTGKENSKVFDVGNYTSNIKPMFDKAFNTTDWKYINGMKAKDALRDITNAYLNMLQNPNEYKKLNPKNGWGSYEGAINYIKILMDGCVEHPETTIEISY